MAVWAQNRGDDASGKVPLVHLRPRDSGQAVGWTACAGVEKTEVGTQYNENRSRCIVLQVPSVEDAEMWQQVTRVLGTVGGELKYRELQRQKLEQKVLWEQRLGYMVLCGQGSDR